MHLADAAEANLADWVLTRASRLDDVEVRRADDVCWVFSRGPAPENTVALARFTAREVDERVGSVLRRHLRHGLACNWITGPMSRPASLGDALRRAGFHCMIHCAGMACDLASVPATVPAPPGVDVQPAAEWPAFAPLTTPRRRRAQAMADGLAAMDPRRAWHFAATLDGAVVGRTTLFAGAALPGVYDVEVLKHARLRGVGTALVHAALRQAARMGHQRAVLTATGAGFGIYARLGFAETSKISFWRYGKMRQK